MLQLLCDSFHYVIIDVANPADPIVPEVFDHASCCYIVADRSVHSTRETVRLLRHIEDRDNNPPTSLLLNNPNAGQPPARWDRRISCRPSAARCCMRFCSKAMP